MAVLASQFNPTIPTSGPAIAPQRSRRNPYLQQFQQGNVPRLPRLNFSQAEESASPVDQDSEYGEAAQQMPTGELIREQLAGLQNRAARPELQPEARITNPSEELVNPTNFQTYFDRLGSIRTIGQEAEAAEAARSSFRRMQSLQDIMGQQVPGFGGASLNYSTPAGPTSIGGSVLAGSPKRAFDYARSTVAPQFGWNNSREINAWYQLGMKESGWRSNAQNPTSTAFGIGQFLDSTWGNYGFKKSSDPAYQIRAMATYIKKRYGSPSRALAFHRSHNWY